MAHRSSAAEDHKDQTWGLITERQKLAALPELQYNSQNASLIPKSPSPQKKQFGAITDTLSKRLKDQYRKQNYIMLRQHAVTMEDYKQIHFINYRVLRVASPQPIQRKYVGLLRGQSPNSSTRAERMLLREKMEEQEAAERARSPGRPVGEARGPLAKQKVMVTTIVSPTQIQRRV